MKAISVINVFGTSLDKHHFFKFRLSGVDLNYTTSKSICSLKKAATKAD